MDKQLIIERIYAGVKGTAIKRSRSREQAEDLMQEGLTAVLETIDKYKDKPIEEVVLLAARIANNRITDVQRREINWTRRSLFVSKIDNNPESTFDERQIQDPADFSEYDAEIDAVYERMFLTTLMARLSSMERAVLREKLDPSKRTVELVEQERTRKMKARAAGVLVMKAESSEVNDTHIAHSLSVSKATVSRVVKSIRVEALRLMQDGVDDSV